LLHHYRAKLVSVIATDYRSLTGAPTTLNDFTVAPVLCSPAYPGKVLRYQVTDEQHGMEFHYVTA
jgi:hypothetical protein